MKHCCDFDGCALGLADSRGQPVQKSWRVCTTMERLVKPLSRRCSRSRVHGQWRGVDAVASGHYTKEMVRIVGNAITGGVNRGVLGM
eukprot:15257503-Heterocapsa_arctica.AAC.1